MYQRNSQFEWNILMFWNWLCIKDSKQSDCYCGFAIDNCWYNEYGILCILQMKMTTNICCFLTISWLSRIRVKSWASLPSLWSLPNMKTRRIVFWSMPTVTVPLIASPVEPPSQPGSPRNWWPWNRNIMNMSRLGSIFNHYGARIILENITVCMYLHFL